MALWIGRSEEYGYEISETERGFDKKSGFAYKPPTPVCLEPLISRIDPELEVGEVREIEEIIIKLKPAKSSAS